MRLRGEDRVVSALAALGGADATRWWADLAPKVRRELVARWTAPAPVGLPVRAEPAPDPEDPDDPGGWHRDLYEYALSHPEVNLGLDRPVFHICTAHAAARAVRREGRVPAGFACPLGRAACPIRGLVEAAGGGVRLWGAVPLRA